MKFKEGVEIRCADFWYDIFDGGYIKPENLLEEQTDIDRVLEAIKTLEEFRGEAEDQEIIDYL